MKKLLFLPLLMLVLLFSSCFDDTKVKPDKEDEVVEKSDNEEEKDEKSNSNVDESKEGVAPNEDVYWSEPLRI